MKETVREQINVWLGLPILCITGSFAATIIIGTLAKKVGLL